MNAFASDIDKQIKQHQQQIEELERLKIAQEEKFEGLVEFDTEIKRLCNQRSLTEAELYVSRSTQIEEWIIGMSKEAAPSSIYTSLRKHFEKVIQREGKASSKPSTLPKPKLAVGTYRNPATNERIEKVKRNPRQLDEWISEYGFEVVRTWKEG